jgi:hypothetical protein
MDDAGQERHERFIAKLLKDRNKAEALAWLSGGAAGSFRNLGELETNEESVALVREVYALGAVQVLAMEIDSYDGADGNSGKLVIELPEDEAARGRVFAWCARQGEKLGFEGDEDFGQRYLFVMLD